jgi:hypothetical protein
MPKEFGEQLTVDVGIFKTKPNITHLVVYLAVELLLSLSSNSLVLVLGEELVSNQGKRGICRLRRIESC